MVNGEWEFQSAAFDNASPEDEDDCPQDMSVVLGDTLEQLARTPEALPAEGALTGPDYGVAALPVQYLRDDEGQTALRTHEDDEQAHGDICGPKPGKRRKRIKKHARWMVRPAAHPPAPG